MTNQVETSPSVLLLDPAYAEVWGRVMPEVAWEVLAGGEAPCLDPDRASPPGDLEPFDVARAHAGRYDFVLGELTPAFLWHAIFRLVGDTTPFILIPRFNHVLARHAYAMLLSSQLASVGDLVYTSCEAAERSLDAFGFRTDPGFLPGIDLATFRPLDEPKSALRAALGLPADKDLLLFVGRLEDDKNLLELLDVLARVRRERPAELVVCYHFHRDAYLEACRKVAEAVGGVHFVHAPDKERLVRYYNAADLLVTAAVSLFETFGRAPVEAMACGTVPVVSDYDGFRQTVPRSIGYRVPTRRTATQHRPDVAGLAAAVLKALGDRQTLAERSEAAVEHARRFDEPNAVAGLRSRFRESPGALASAGARDGDGGTIELAGYPRAVRALWGPLEGRALDALVREFLCGWAVPVRPARETIREYYWSWFEHY